MINQTQKRLTDYAVWEIDTVIKLEFRGFTAPLARYVKKLAI